MSDTTPAVIYHGRDPFIFRNVASSLRQTTTLLRRELRENRWFILTSIPILALVPLQYALGTYTHVYPGDGFGIIIILLAAFAGIISGLRDLTDRRQDFWRSRPIRPHIFAATRLLAALISWSFPAALAFIAYVMVCSLHGRRPDAPNDPYTLALSYLLTANLPQIFFAFAAFAIAHLAATLTRSAVDTALLTLTVLIALWLLPVILPPLSFLSTLQTQRNAPITIGASGGAATWNYSPDAVYIRAMGVGINLRMHFLIHNAGMLAIAAAATALSCVALVRNWHLPMSRKFTVWSLGLCGVFMLAAAGLQIRSDLSSTQELTLLSPASGKPCLITQFIQTDRQLLAIALDANDIGPSGAHPHYAFPLTDVGTSWSIGKPIPLGPAPVTILSPETHPHLWTPAQPDRIYTFDILRIPSGNRKAATVPTDHLMLRETSLSPDTAGQVLRETDLPPIVVKNGAPLVAAYRNTLVLRPADTTILPYDLASNPATAREPIALKPQDTWEALQSFDNSRTGTGQPHTPYTLNLYKVDALAPDELLDLNLKLVTSVVCTATYASGSLTLFDYNRIRAYRQVDLTPTLARFAPVGRYDFSAVESLMYSHQLCTASGASGDWAFRLYFSGLRLFHLDNSSIRLAGQFNRPADQLRAAHLTPHHLLIAGPRLYIVTLPQKPSD